MITCAHSRLAAELTGAIAATAAAATACSTGLVSPHACAADLCASRHVIPKIPNRGDHPILSIVVAVCVRDHVILRSLRHSHPSGFSRDGGTEYFPTYFSLSFDCECSEVGNSRTGRGVAVHCISRSCTTKHICRSWNLQR